MLRDLINSFPEPQNNILVNWPFIKAFLDDKIPAKTFLDDLRQFTLILISQNISRSNLDLLEISVEVIYRKHGNIFYVQITLEYWYAALDVIIKYLRIRVHREISRMRLLKGLNDNTLWTDTQPHVSFHEKQIRELSAKIDALPKNWFGIVKDKGLLKKLQESMEHEKRQLANVHPRANDKMSIVIPLAYKLQLSSDITHEESSRLLESSINSVKVTEQQMNMVFLQRRVLSIKIYNHEEAQQIFGDNFYGPARVYETFGLKLSKNEVPPLPERAIMERARSLGAVLALRVYNVMSGECYV